MRAIVVTHGDLGRELLASARLVVSADAPVEVISNRNLDAPALRAAIAEWLAGDGAPALILVDEPSGSCASAARLASYRREDTWIVAGLNLAMLITYLGRWRELEGEELVEKIVHRAREAVRRLEVPR